LRVIELSQRDLIRKYLSSCIDTRHKLCTRSWNALGGTEEIDQSHLNVAIGRIRRDFGTQFLHCIIRTAVRHIKPDQLCSKRGLFWMKSNESSK